MSTSSDVLSGAERLRARARSDHSAQSEAAAMERQLAACERERLQQHFLGKQSSSQKRKLELQVVALERQLRSVRRCAACSCLAGWSSRGRRFDAAVSDRRKRPPNASPPPPPPSSSAPGSSHTACSSDADGRARHLTDELDSLRRANSHLRASLAQLQAMQPTSNRDGGGSNAEQSAAVLSLLREKDAEIKGLRARLSTVGPIVTPVEVNEPRLPVVSEVQERLKKMEAEVESLRSHGDQLKAQSTALQRSLGSKETNLQRCEGQLAAAHEEARRLQAENGRLQRQAPPAAGAGSLRRAQSQVDVTGRSRASTAERALRVSTNERPRSVSKSPRRSRTNPYCPVCRNFKVALTRSFRPLRAVKSDLASRLDGLADLSPDSGFGDRETVEVRSQEISAAEIPRLRDTISKLRTEKRIMEHEKETLNKLYESALEDATRLRRDLFNTQRPSDATRATAPDDSARLRTARVENDELRKRVQKLTQQLESAKARRTTNESLLQSQKSCLEHDLDALKSKCAFMEGQIRDLTDRLSQKDAALAQNSAQISQQRESRADVASHQSELRRQVASLTAQLTRATEGKSDAEQQLAQCRRELGETKAAVAQCQQRSVQLGAELDELLRGADRSPLADVVQLQLQLADREREVTHLRQAVADLYSQHSQLKSTLTEQENSLAKLEADLSATISQKSCSDATVDELRRENVELRRQLDALSLDYREAVEVQERHVARIEQDQRLLAEKEAARTALLAQLQDANVEMRRSEAQRSSVESAAVFDGQLRHVEQRALQDELAAVRQQKDALSAERATFAAQVHSCEASLRDVRAQLETEREQKRSLHADLVAARQQLIARQTDADAVGARLTTAAADLEQARRTASDVRAELELTKARLLAEQATVAHLESSVGSSREHEAQASVDAQQKGGQVRLLKEKLVDCEAKLELQGRELTAIRDKLNTAEDALRRLRRQLSEERYEKDRLQERFRTHSSTSS